MENLKIIFRYLLVFCAFERCFTVNILQTIIFLKGTEK